MLKEWLRKQKHRLDRLQVSMGRHHNAGCWGGITIEVRDPPLLMAQPLLSNTGLRQYHEKR